MSHYRVRHNPRPAYDPYGTIFLPARRRRPRGRSDEVVRHVCRVAPFAFQPVQAVGA